MPVAWPKQGRVPVAKRALEFAILETGAVIDPAVDKTASSADLLLLGGVHAQWRPGRRSQPRIHLPRAPMAESGRALLVARSGTAARGAETRRTRRLHRQGLASAIDRPTAAAFSPMHQSHTMAWDRSTLALEVLQVWAAIGVV